MNQNPDITVVVPVYNSVETLEPLFNGIERCLSAESKTFEVLFVEDGSSEESWKELQRLKGLHSDSIRLIRLARNYGQNAATVCGIANSKGAAVITIDDDLQTPPAEISKLLKHQKSTDSDIVFGITSSQSNPFFKRAGSNLMKRVFLWADGAEIGSSFRYISPQLKEQLAVQSYDQLFLNQVVHWYTERIGKVVVEHESRKEGKSGYSFLNLIGMALRLIIFYTDFPLRMMSISGILIAMVCFGIGIFFIYERIVIGTEPGFASIVTAIFFTTGIIMICLSILGTYISRIYADRIKKPVYAIKTIVQ
ncbi:MAG: glycosyltransferase [Flavobacteriales bacterium]|nr:glycosyltransferase [Flavobacteriales bacterium]